MKVVVAVDSFKGSLSSMDAGNAIEKGIHEVDENIRVEVYPLADGGEGTVDALVNGLGGRFVDVDVHGPLGKIVKSTYGILNDHVCVMEMASASGLPLVDMQERNPLYTTSYGVGEMIVDAIRKGCREFIVGIGGSATNDGGVGMLQALGYHFLDANGKEVQKGGIGLESIAKITDDDVIRELAECSFKIACDVNNPLCGKNGASYVFGPQKGADQETVERLDQGLAHFAKVASAFESKADATYPGTGAAGGLGFGFLTFTNAKLQSGIQIVLEETQLEKHLIDADFIVTGEGRLDSQTAMGKAPIGVASLAKKYNKTVLAFAGCVRDDAKLCNKHGIDAFFPIIRKASTLEEAMDHENAVQNLIDTGEQVFRLIQKVGK